MPEPIGTWPAAVEVKRFLKTHGYGVALEGDDEKELREAILRAKRKVMRLTQKNFSLETDTRTFNGNGGPWIFCGWMKSVTAVSMTFLGDLRPVNYNFTIDQIVPEWVDLPYIDQNTGTWDRGFQQFRLMSNANWPYGALVEVTGSFGYSDGPPDDVQHAAQLYASSDVAPMYDGGQGGTVLEWHGPDRSGEVYREDSPADGPWTWMRDAALLLQPFIPQSIPIMRRPHGQPGAKVSVTRTTPR